MIEKDAFGFFVTLGLMMIVIALTVIQFRYVEKKVQY